MPMEIDNDWKLEMQKVKQQLENVVADVEKIKENLGITENAKRVTWEDSANVVAHQIMSTLRRFVKELNTDVMFLVSTFNLGRSIHVSGRRSNELGESDLKTAEELLSPLSNIERLRILLSLYKSDKYTSELASVVNVAPGTLHYHLKELEGIGFITQERERGKYLITWTGSVAVELVGLMVGEYVDGGKTGPLLRKGSSENEQAHAEHAQKPTR